MSCKIEKIRLPAAVTFSVNSSFSVILQSYCTSLWTHILTVTWLRFADQREAVARITRRYYLFLGIKVDRERMRKSSCLAYIFSVWQEKGFCIKETSRALKEFQEMELKALPYVTEIECHLFRHSGVCSPLFPSAIITEYYSRVHTESRTVMTSTTSYSVESSQSTHVLCV